MRKDRTVRTTLTISLIILLSKIVGFAREMIMAAYFGAGAQSDAFYMAGGVVFVFMLLMMSCINSTFVPIYIEAGIRSGRDSANRYANNMLHFFVLLAVVLSAVAYVVAPSLIKLIAFGFDEESLAMTVHLTRVLLPCLSMMVVSMVFGSLLNAHERFIPQQLIGFALSVFQVLPVLLFSEQYGIFAAAYGMIAAVIVQVFLLTPFMRGLYRYEPVLDLADARFRQSMKLALPAILGMTVNEINHMVNRALASSLPAGSVTALNYSYRLTTSVLGVFVVPISTIMFSRMSAYAAVNDKKSIVALIRRCIEIIALIVLPICAIGIALNEELVRLVYQRGAFDAAAATVTSIAFFYYIVGVYFFGLRDVLNRAFFSLKNARSPLFIGIASVSVNLVLNLILVRVMGIGGLALATSVSALISAALMLISLRKKLGKIGLFQTGGQLILILLSACLAGGASLWCKNALHLDSELVRVGLSGLAGCIAYVLGVLLLGVREARKAASDVSTRLKSKIA